MYHSNIDPSNLPPRANPMSHFEKRLRLWLAGFGMSSAQCDILCAHPRIAYSIRTNDAGGIIQDLGGCLGDVQATLELYAALSDPSEMIFLAMALR